MEIEIDVALKLLEFTLQPYIVSVDAKQWNDVIGLYATILECVTCSSKEVRFALKEALQEFQDLLRSPAH